MAILTYFVGFVVNRRRKLYQHLIRLRIRETKRLRSCLVASLLETPARTLRLWWLIYLSRWVTVTSRSLGARTIKGLTLSALSGMAFPLRATPSSASARS